MKVAVVTVALLTSIACGDDRGRMPTGPTLSATSTIGLIGTLEFGDVAVGSSVTADFKISNLGQAAFSVTSLSTGDMSTVLLLNWSRGTIAPGASRVVTVQFAPTAAQLFSGELTVASDATSGTSTMRISGTGTAVTAPTLPIHFLMGGVSQEYLGFFGCIFCVEVGTNSINNFVGEYGSQFSAKSIRSKSSTYGSASSDYSACNPFAKHPPGVFDAIGGYVGELTLNESRNDAVKSPEIVNWLRTSVCKH